MTEIFAVSLLEESDFVSVRTALLNRVPGIIHAKINSFVRNNDAQRSLLGEVMARHLLRNAGLGDLPDLPFSTGPKGKPGQEGFQGIHFNISHSGNWVVVALSDDVVGVDVEKMRKVPEGVARRFFSEHENKMINSAADEKEKAEIFFTLWTLKESFLKAIGTGLTKNLNSFTIFDSGNGEYTLQNDPEAEGFFLKTFFLCDQYKLAACARSVSFKKEVKIFTVPELMQA